MPNPDSVKRWTTRDILDWDEKLAGTEVFIIATDYETLEIRCAELTRKNKNRRRNAHANRKLIGTLKGRVAEQAETITRLRRDGEPWTLRDTLTVLAEAVEHLTIHHSCDCHGYEQYIAAKRAAWEIVAALSEGEK